MRQLLTLTLILLLAGSAPAIDLGNQRPDKPTVTYPQSLPNPDRQGGDTIADAVELDLLVIDETGTTVGYTDDYDEVCPYDGSTSPDVVYTFTPMADIAVDIDMLGSTYDTKIYVYDESLTLVACNDDFYPDYVSKLENVLLVGGTRYYLVIDGYGGDAGDYVLNIAEYDPCVLTCPAGAELEGEPPLVDGYIDSYNCGCSGPEFGYPMGAITADIFCGVSGWYISVDGSSYRDTDWFEIVVPDVGFIEIIGDAEYPTYMFELGPQDCASVVVIQDVIIGACAEGTMVIPGAVGSTIWFFVASTTWSGPVNEYNYVLFTNLTPVATELHCWSDVKALFH